MLMSRSCSTGRRRTYLMEMMRRTCSRELPRKGRSTYFKLYCIVLYLLPVLSPKSYDGARVLEASGRPMLVIGRS